MTSSPWASVKNLFTIQLKYKTWRPAERRKYFSYNYCKKGLVIVNCAINYWRL